MAVSPLPPTGIWHFRLGQNRVEIPLCWYNRLQLSQKKMDIYGFSGRCIQTTMEGGGGSTTYQIGMTWASKLVSLSQCLQQLQSEICKRTKWSPRIIKFKTGQ